MKNDIIPGQLYFDDKDGLREVVALLDNDSLVQYRVLAARQERRWSYALDAWCSLIGQEISCTRAAFAAWAKVALSAEAGAALLLELQAGKIKLSPAERLYLLAAQTTAGFAGLGARLPIKHTEGRAISGLAKKGLLVRVAGEASVTALGAAWFRRMSASPTPQP